MHRHFKLNAEPFALTPDPNFLYLSAGHSEALAALKVGLRQRRGLMVMTGEVGTGKTTLLYALLSEPRPEIHTAYVCNTRLSFVDIMRLALADYGLTVNSTDKLALLTALNQFLRQCADEGSTAALVIDEAQNLSADMFEDLRLLSNFETFDTKLLQIVMVGQPELNQKLQQRELRQVNERVAVRVHIEPLSRRDSVSYIEHRLECVGGSPDLFTRPALRLIVGYARGIPRRINMLCHDALLFAYGRDATRVTRRLAGAALRARHRRVPLWRLRWRGWSEDGRYAAAAGVLLLCAIGVAGAAIGYRSERDVAPAPTTTDAAAAAPPSDAAAPAAIPAPPARAPSAAGDAPAGNGAVNAVPAPDSPPVGADPPPAAADGAGDDAPSAAPPAADRSEQPAHGGAATIAAPLPRPALDSMRSSEPDALRASRGAHADDQDDEDDHDDDAGDLDRPAYRNFRTVRVVQGTTLGAIAKEVYGADLTPELVHRIRLANPQIADPNFIRAGDTLRFPQTASGRGRSEDVP